MTEDRLPDDQTRWPTDPYQLLGVNANVDERGLKRAYAKLIHQFTPEHHPQQFARIRAAFEQLLVFLQWRSQFRVIETKHETTDAPAEHQPEDIPHSPQHPDSKINASRDADEPVKLPDLEIGRNEQFSAGRDPRDEPSKPINRLSSQRKVSIEEGLNEAWRTAIQGDPVQGYRQLLNLASQFEHHCEIYLRLYWLQRLFPEVDSTRHNVHCLIIALQRTEIHDSPRQL
ncbi:MAG: dnaJ 1 [Planctomycetaceae bacterium]|nr:dnaJ 1 [Planctomycetaceae bacterium]